jgi:hypothetical protein
MTIQDKISLADIEELIVNYCVDKPTRSAREALEILCAAEPESEERPHTVRVGKYFFPLGAVDRALYA